FWLPEGAKFFTYSKDKKQSLGAFTSKNNKGDRCQPRGFATRNIYTSNMILEYFQPKETDIDAIISIEYIVHGYKYINRSNSSPYNAGDCTVNVNCDKGLDWQDEKNAIAMVAVENYRYCTGSLLNTTNFSQAPLFLTANHCIYDLKDAEMDPNLDQTIFYWNYETTGCLNDSLNPIYTTSSATVLANNSLGDFALLRLSEDPKELPDYTPYYLGWDATGQAGEPGVCIHHPQGDVKKISIVAVQPYPATYIGTAVDEYMDHWCITAWESIQNRLSIVQRGSSGSPLLNASHKVIGQLHGGLSNCNNGVNGPDWFGRLSSAWYGEENPYIPNTVHKRLHCWLDSLGTRTEILEGLLVIRKARTFTKNRNLFSNIRITSTGCLTIQSEIDMMGNSTVLVEEGGVLTIDGGIVSNADIILKDGAKLRVINGGIINTRNALKAPVGAKIEIEFGIIE
ncbi:MAG: trypsin-like peptidase domain-containing protein, partial [Bacteroidaceae bacterium]|nr:trypsin-like peptidase domain-containing protein [Bacteroidaceae bacterium]